ncbi:MAG: ABC transporter ATP-binding protein [Nitrososphaerales archaeon]
MSVVMEDVQKTYSTGGYATAALLGISANIKSGEFACIMGPSGSGKSTLMNLVGALDRPTRGRIIVDGQDLSMARDDQLADFRNRKISFIFQSFNLIHRLSALENVMLPLLVKEGSMTERIRTSMKALESVGLKHRIRHTPDRLSGGEQQRVAMARALVTNPKIILGDEPTGNLDTKTAESVVGLLKQLNRDIGLTLIIVTHSQEIAEKADKILYVRDGLLEKIETKKKN